MSSCDQNLARRRKKIGTNKVVASDVLLEVEPKFVSPK
jgi:hypothetical protein